MTPTQLKERLQDWGWVRAAVADRDRLALLPQCETTILALPSPCQPFQARWLLGGCSDETLRTLRGLHPEIVAHRNGRKGSGRRHAYDKAQLCRLIGRRDLAEVRNV